MTSNEEDEKSPVSPTKLETTESRLKSFVYF